MQLRYAETRFRMKPYSAGLNALKPSRHGVHSAGPWRVRRLHGGCVRSLCRNPDQKRPVVCFDESPIATHRRACADRSRPTPVSSNTTIASTSATAPSVCSSSSMRALALGARWTSPTVAPRSASPPVCATLADGHFSKAERIRAVLNNMSTHSVGALYQAFLPAEARRLLCWLSSTTSPSIPAG